MQNVTSIAIGGFDGMHIGHQTLFRELGANGAIVVIETGHETLTPKRQRDLYTKYPIYYIQLENVREYNGKEFLALIQEKFPNLKKIVVGYDFHFGKDRKCSFEDLKRIFDAEVKIVQKVTFDNDSVHSRKIISMIKDGNIEGANNYLGRNYSITGQHVRGQGIGAKELVATINIQTKDYSIPKEGVYVTLTRVDDEEHYHPSVSFIGHRQTTDGSFAIESHILDGEILCNKKASISFVSYIRENQKFDSLKELKKAISNDIEIASKKLKQLQI